MLPFAIWIMGVLAASAATAEAEQTRAARLDALKHRLNLGEGQRYLLSPSRGGVTVWMWPDHHRIVRLVTDDQLDVLAASFADHIEFFDTMVDGVTPGHEDFEEVEAPGWATFAYLDEHNRPYAVIGVEEGRLVDLAGSDDGTVSSRVRSRVYQFLRDYELDDDLDDDSAFALFHDDFSVPAGLMAALDRVEQGFASPELHAAFYDDLRERLGAESRDYVDAYEDLFAVWRDFRAGADELDELATMDGWTEKFVNWLDDRGELEVLEDRGYDPDQIKAAMLEGDVEAEQALRDQGLDLGSEVGLQLEWRADYLWEDHGRELEKVVTQEAEAFNLLLPWHRLLRFQAYRHPDSLASFVIRTESSGGNSSKETEIIDRLTFDFAGWNNRTPTWNAQGHSDPAHPGFLRALDGAGYIEPLDQLYDAAPDETIFEWPGAPTPELEALALLGEQIDVVNLSLPEFLRVSFKAGLLHPDTITYWAELLHPHEMATSGDVAR